MTFQNKQDYSQFKILLRLALERNKICDKIQQDKIITKVISKQKRKSSKQQSLHRKIHNNLIHIDKKVTHLTIKDILTSDLLSDYNLSYYNRYIIFLLSTHTHKETALILGMTRMTLYNKLIRIREGLQKNR